MGTPSGYASSGVTQPSVESGPFVGAEKLADRVVGQVQLRGEHSPARIPRLPQPFASGPCDLQVLAGDGVGIRIVAHADQPLGNRHHVLDVAAFVR